MSGEFYGFSLGLSVWIWSLGISVEALFSAIAAANRLSKSATIYGLSR